MDEKGRGKHSRVEDVHGLSFVSICAMLEDAGYRRDQIKHLTRWYVKRVLQHARDKNGELILPKHQQQKKTLSEEEKIRNIWRRRGYPERYLERKVQESLELERKRRAAMIARRGGRIRKQD